MYNYHGRGAPKKINHLSCHYKMEDSLMNNIFDNKINVIDITGKHLHPSYTHRAKGLVKNGRAEWVDEKTIRLVGDTFHEYLTKNGAKPAYIEKNISLENALQAADSIADFLSGIWHGGLKGDGKGAGLGAEQDAYRFLDEYASYCGDSSEFADAYSRHINDVFEQPAKKAVAAYKRAIRIIPDDVVIDPYYLHGLSNNEYVTAFRALQELIHDKLYKLENNIKTR